MWSRNHRARHCRSRGRGHWNNRGRGRGISYRKPQSNDPFQRRNDFDRDRDRNRVRPVEQIIEKLNEKDVGVTEFISDHKGFTGVLKARYSDFHVNEIDLDGKVAKLTDLKVPVDVEPVVEDDDEIVVKRYRIEQLPTETWDKIHKMVETHNQDEVVEIDVTTMTKEDRTKIHESVKTVFGRKILGQTITKDDKKFVTIRLYTKNDKIDRREKWPVSRGGEYVYFLVHKEYTDTIEANMQISEKLRMRASSFCYAGVKDRRAITTQWFCVRKSDPQRISDRTRNLRNIQIGNFCYKQETLKLGQLKGNKFRIALRSITADNSILDSALESLRDNGFINYYGLQRFGNCKEAPTHEIGKLLLTGKWKEAVQLILKPRKFERDRDVSAAKHIYEDTGNASQAYGRLEKKRDRCIEGKLLEGLKMHADNDYVNALENIPRNMRLLYIHAFQSYIWNQMVSRRIKEFGMKPIVGDIVVEGNLNENEQFLDISENTVENLEEETDAADPEPNDSVQQQIKVKILTEADLPNYTIYDIVLPLPGFDMTYPGNCVKDWYKELLEENGLSLEMPKQKVKTYTLSGDYRKIVERVTDLSWKTIGYNEPTSILIRSDYEELIGQPEPKDIPNAPYKALIIEFNLPSSSYATMALREVMKMDTSVETHMHFNNTVQSTDNEEETNIPDKTNNKEELDVNEVLTEPQDETENAGKTGQDEIENKEVEKADDIKQISPDETANQVEPISIDTNDADNKRKLTNVDEVDNLKKMKTE